MEMTYQQKYQKSKEAGYSDEDILGFLSKQDPSFDEKMKKSQETGYTPEEVLKFFNGPKEEKELGLGDYASDFAKQGAQGFGIGAIGTYGDILDLLGLQNKEILPNEQAKYSREFNVLEKMERGEVPSFGELLELSGEDEGAPRFSRLPSGQDVESLGKQLNVVSEPETVAGRYGKRIGKIGGSAASLGGTSLLAPIVAGTVGQTLEEAGAPPWAQAAGEIIASLATIPKSNVPITSKTKEVEQTIQKLRKAGYSEKDITLAKSALEERNLLKKYSTLTPEAENAINTGLKNSDELFKEQIKKGLPGYAEGGLPYLEKQASNVYQSMEELASSVPIKNTEPVKKAVQNAIDYLEKYPLLDEQKKFIEFMKDGLVKLEGAKNTGQLAKAGEGGLTAEFLTGFYRNLGKAGKWGDPKQKEHLLGLVRQGIKDTFAESGPEAAKFGKYFEKTNEAWKKWLNTRDLMETLEKAQTVEGTNFKKVASILNEPTNHELAKKVLGPEQLENIKTISKGADAIGSLLKQIPRTNKSVEEVKFLSAIFSLLSQGNAGPMTALIGADEAKKLFTSFLIDPKRQNILKKIIVSSKNNSPQQAAILSQELAKDVSLEPKKNRGPSEKR